MKKYIKFLGFILLIAGFLGATTDFIKQKKRENLDMIFVQDNSFCTECHSNEKVQQDFTDPAKACHQFCLTCHKDMKQHHPLDVKMEFSASMRLPLFKNQTVTCFTCHDLNNAKFDVISWKAQNVFQRVFNRKKKYKTYYLRINNRSGSLCKQCH